MNPIEEHPFDEIETAASMAIGLTFLLARAWAACDTHPSGGPSPSEKEGIEVLMLEVGDRLRKATDSIRDMTPEDLRATADSPDALQAASDRAAEPVETKGGAA